MFFMGLFLGLAVSSMLVLAVVLGAVFTGRMPFAAKAAGLAAAPTAPLPTNPNDNLPPAQPVKDVDEKRDHIIGAKNAKVTLIEYSDYQCPFCKRHEPTMKAILQQFPKDVRLVYRHYPLRSIHQDAARAAEGTECAAKLGGNDAYWKMHDKVFENQESGIGAAALLAMAKAVGLNEAKFKSCLESGEMAQRVQEDESSGNDAGVQGTPATFVNGRLVSGAVPLDQFKSMIQQAGGKE